MKFLLTFIIIVSSLYSVELMEYKKAIKAAKDECKPMMLVVYKDDCSACDNLFADLESSVLLNSMLEDYITSTISIKDASAIYGAKIAVTPTIFFMNPDKAEIMKPIEGQPASLLDFVEYLQLGSIASEEFVCK